MKKLYLSLLGILLAWLSSSVFATCNFEGSTFEQEWKEAYFWSCNEWIINEQYINNAKLNQELSRIEMARMLNIFATKLMRKEQDPSRDCKWYSDLNNNDSAIANKACYLWIMWIWISKFRPNDSVSRAEFGTVLSRILYWDTYNVTNWKYYEKHLKALKDNGIITNTNPNIKEKKGYVLLMLKRYIDNKEKWNIKEEVSKTDGWSISRKWTDVTFSDGKNSITLSSEIKTSKDWFAWSDSLQWPCAPWYHVPSKDEFYNLMKIWMNIKWDELYNAEISESWIGQSWKEKYDLVGRAVWDMFLSDIYWYKVDAKHPTNMKAQPLFWTRSIDYASNSPYYVSIGTYRDYMSSRVSFQKIWIKSKLYKVICFKTN